MLSLTWVVIEMRQDAFDYRRIFDAGNYLHLPATARAGFYLDLEHPIQSLRPTHRRVALYPGLLRTRRWPPCTLRGPYLLTQMMVGRANYYLWRHGSA